MRESLQIIIGMDEAESIKQDMVSVVEDGLDIILTKMVTNENGEVEYIPPTDKEFEAVAEIYEKM